MSTAPIVSRVWSFCTTLRDDGVSYGDYLEQLTYFIFLKMADEYGKPPYRRDVGIPAAYDWQSLRTKRGAGLEGHYVTLLRELGTGKGMLGQIFTKALNKIQDPAKLYRLIDMVSWYSGHRRPSLFVVWLPAIMATYRGAVNYFAGEQLSVSCRLLVGSSGTPLRCTSWGKRIYPSLYLIA